MMIYIYITGEGEWKLTLAYPGLTATMRYPLMLQAFIVVVHIVPEARLHRPRGEFLKNVQFPKIYVRKNTFERVWNFWQLVARFFKRATRSFVHFESEQNSPSFSLFIANFCGVVIFHVFTTRRGTSF